jgi:hypothetical protein
MRCIWDSAAAEQQGQQQHFQCLHRWLRNTTSAWNSSNNCLATCVPATSPPARIASPTLTATVTPLPLLLRTHIEPCATNAAPIFVLPLLVLLLGLNCCCCFLPESESVSKIWVYMHPSRGGMHVYCTLVDPARAGGRVVNFIKPNKHIEGCNLCISSDLKSCDSILCRFDILFKNSNSDLH